MAKKAAKPSGLGRGLDSILEDNRPVSDRSEGQISIRRPGGTVSMNRAEIGKTARHGVPGPRPFAAAESRTAPVNVLADPKPAPKTEAVKTAPTQEPASPVTPVTKPKQIEVRPTQEAPVETARIRSEAARTSRREPSREEPSRRAWKDKLPDEDLDWNEEELNALPQSGAGKGGYIKTTGGRILIGENKKKKIR